MQGSGRRGRQFETESGGATKNRQAPDGSLAVVTSSGPSSNVGFRGIRPCRLSAAWRRKSGRLSDFKLQALRIVRVGQARITAAAAAALAAGDCLCQYAPGLGRQKNAYRRRDDRSLTGFFDEVATIAGDLDVVFVVVSHFKLCLSELVHTWERKLNTNCEQSNYQATKSN
ncbi:MAG: hypothetical protein H6978_10400 [Gammaproteobacteria bacterium]|nr:hypothetical protein [Gammaproteobacteria bacterium]